MKRAKILFISKIYVSIIVNAHKLWFITLASKAYQIDTRTTDTQWRHKSKISEKLGRYGRQNMLRPYLKIWDWDWIFGRAVKAIFSLGVRSPWLIQYKMYLVKTKCYTLYACQYNSQLVYFLHHFWSPLLCFQGGFFQKFCPYVWLVFKGSF